MLAEATLVKVEGRRLIFTVSAARLEAEGGGLVGAGRVTRVVVDRSAFLAKAGTPGKPSRATPAATGGPRLLAGAGPVVAAFVTFGLFWGSWAVMLFNVQHAFSLNDAQLGVLLAVAIAVAGASSAVMAHLADRVGARRLLWIALFAWSVLLCVLALTREKWAFATVLVLVEVAGRLHRHGHERGGVPPARGQPVGTGAPPCPVQRRRTDPGGGGRAGDPRRRARGAGSGLGHGGGPGDRCLALSRPRHGALARPGRRGGADDPPPAAPAPRRPPRDPPCSSSRWPR